MGKEAEVAELGQRCWTQNPVLSGSRVQIPPSALIFIYNLSVMHIEF